MPDGAWECPEQQQGDGEGGSLTGKHSSGGRYLPEGCEKGKQPDPAQGCLPLHFRWGGESGNILAGMREEKLYSPGACEKSEQEGGESDAGLHTGGGEACVKGKQTVLKQGQNGAGSGKLTIGMHSGEMSSSDACEKGEQLSSVLRVPQEVARVAGREQAITEVVRKVGSRV